MATCQASLKHSLAYPDGATTLVGCSATTINGNNAYECQVTRNGNWKTACRVAGSDTEQVHFYWAGGCEQRNGALGGPSRPSRWSNTTSTCVGGCKYEIEPGTAETQTITKGQLSTGLYGGKWYYPGGTCTYPTQPGMDHQAPPEPDSACVPAGNGETYCQQPNGDKCHTASTGRTICWSAGETGEKTDGPTLQRNENGPNSTPPVNAPSPPTTLNPGTPTNVTTTGPSGTVTITITNWTTSTGGPAGPNNQGSNTGPNGAPATGSGNNCDPTKGPCGNTASGGETCGSPPITGGDPLLGMVAKQAWQTRCTVEGSLAADGGCNAPAPACTGSKVLCGIAERERQRKCQEDQRRTEFNSSLESDAAADDGTDDISVDDIWGDGDLPTTADLSTGLFGGSVSTCPFEYSYGGRRVELPSQFWVVASFIRLLLLAAAYIWVAQMLL